MMQVDAARAAPRREANRRRTISAPITMREAVNDYLASRVDIRESSKVTIRYRIEAFIKGREQSYLQLFPAKTAWLALVNENSVDTLYGIRSAAQGFFKWCVLQGQLKRAPLENVEIVGRKRRGKPQLRMDEGRRFLELALSETPDADNQERIARLGAATALLLGLRSSEVIGRQVRDLDDGGTMFVIPTSKTDAGERTLEVPDRLRPYLLQLVQGRASTEPLFPGLTKDGLRYWTETALQAGRTPSRHATRLARYQRDGFDAGERQPAPRCRCARTCKHWRDAPALRRSERGGRDPTAGRGKRAYY
jgi:integrase